MHIEEILSSPITWIIVSAVSEIIALLPIKDNSVIQLVFHVLHTLKGKKA